VSSFRSIPEPSAAAQRLGVSAKALRLYEQRGLWSEPHSGGGGGLMVPTKWPGPRGRSPSRIGFSLSQVARCSEMIPRLEPALPRTRQHSKSGSASCSGAAEKVRGLRLVLYRASPQR